MPRQSRPHLHRCGRWRFRYKSETFWADSEGDAWDNLAKQQKLTTIDAGVAPLTVMGLGDAWLLDRYGRDDANPRRERIHRQQLDDFNEFAKDMRLSDVRPNFFTQYLAALRQKNYKPSTIQKRMAYARAAIAHAVDMDWVAKMPKRVKVPKAVHNPEPIGDEDLAAIFAELHCHTDTFGNHTWRRAGQLLAFRLETGCRPSEACALRWAHFRPGDGEHGVFVLADHKAADSTGKTRTIYLTRNARKIVDAQRRGDRVFLNRKREAYKASGVRSTWYRAAKAALGHSLRPYALRHTFATSAVRRGLSPYVLMELMGHASISTTQAYYDVARSDVLQAAASLTSAVPDSPQLEQLHKKRRKQRASAAGNTDRRSRGKQASAVRRGKAAGHARRRA